MTETEWQPIETAPQGERVLVAKAGGFRFIACKMPDFDGDMTWFNDGGGKVLDLIHWHPLPDPPQGEE